jgi:phosphoribosylanthranilate isomerase
MIYVKICGITNLEDALMAAEAGADFLGFVFVPGSPRYIAPEAAGEIMAAVREGNHKSRPYSVGVFVNEPLEHIREVMAVARLDFAQLHGHEAAQLVRALWPRVYKSLRPRDGVEAQEQVEEYRTAINGNVPAFIVDAFDAHKFGGTGHCADWNVAAQIARRFPILLAGGLNPENVAEAIHIVRPWGVDVSSGVERAPGLKDHANVRRFVQVAKGVILSGAKNLYTASQETLRFAQGDMGEVSGR